jgi:hypothetical protein
MKATVVLATSLALCAVTLSASSARAQALCAVAPSVIDSARADIASVLFSNSPLAADLRREQGIPPSPAQVSVSVIREPSLCERVASKFDQPVSPNSKIALLRIGPIYYARHPDQRHATGIFVDSTLHVLMKLEAIVDK